jgi:DNA-binding NarL/FixJ family response regulator
MLTINLINQHRNMTSHTSNKLSSKIACQHAQGLTSAPSSTPQRLRDQALPSPHLVVADQQAFVHEVIALSRNVALHQLQALRELERLQGLNGSNAQLLIDPETVDLGDRPGSSRMISDGRIRRMFRPYGNQILLFSANRDRKLSQRFLALGASGLLHKTATSKQLFERLETLWLKRRVTALEPQQAVAASIIAEQVERRFDERRSRRRHLSRRQCEVLGLLEQGLANKSISSELGLSLSTVKTHVSAILRALGANNRAHAAFKASSSDF